MLTVAYLANQFPSAVEPYVIEEIEELTKPGSPGDRGERATAARRSIVAGEVRP